MLLSVIKAGRTTVVDEDPDPLSRRDSGGLLILLHLDWNFSKREPRLTLKRQEPTDSRVISANTREGRRPVSSRQVKRSDKQSDSGVAFGHLTGLGGMLTQDADWKSGTTDHTRGGRELFLQRGHMGSMHSQHAHKRGDRGTNISPQQRSFYLKTLL